MKQTTHSSSLTRPFHCDAASLLCRCAAHSEEAALATRLRRGIQEMNKNGLRPCTLTNSKNVVLTEVQNRILDIWRCNMNVLNDICPISDFRDNASTMVAKVRSDNRPLIITQYGKSSAVLISAESYQELLDRIEILSDIAASEEEIANGGGMDQEEFKKELFKKIRQ